MALKDHSIWIAGSIFGVFFLVIGIIVGSTVTIATDTSTSKQQDLNLNQFSDAFAEIAARLNPSVVNITCSEQQESTEGKSGNHGNEYGFGSGVIIDPTGYILTSNHVIDSALRV